MSSSDQEKLSVGFVCLGNICRSPMAEAVFKHVVKESNKASFFKRIDSFGTALYHVGEDPDYRSTQCCLAHGVPVNHHAQKLTLSELKNFDFLLVMDESNLRDVERLKAKTNSKVKVKLFGEYKTDPQYSTIVEDPYYGGSSGFERNYRQIVHFSKNFLEQELPK